MRLAQHLRATRGQLYRLLGSQGRDLPLAVRLGLGETAARSLCWLRQLPAARGGRGYTLGFDDACPGAALPTQLRSALDGTLLPVRAVRGLRHAVAHARWVRACNDSQTFLTGTLGAVLRPDGQPDRRFAVTAGHVFGAAPGAASGDRVRFDLANEAAPPIMGRLLDWQPNFARLPLTCSFDAGLAEVDPEDLRALATQPADWPTGTSSAFAEDRLFLRTRGQAIAGGGVAFLGASLCLNGDTSRSYLLRDALAWRTDSPSQGGDSGAPVWNESDELVAIHAGGQLDDDPLSAIAVPIARVLRWAGSDIVRRSQLLTPGAGVRPAPNTVAVDRDAADVLARTMHGEARGEGEPGLAAVAHVVLNRVCAQSWWGRDVASVCRKPFQFSCWNEDDPNRDLLLRLTAASPGFGLAQDTAARVLAAEADGSRARNDPTAGATHYYAWRVMAPPRWALGRTPCARIGGHVFFKGVG